MQNDMNDKICENSFVATMRYIPLTTEYQEKLVKFSWFSENAGNGPLHDVIEAREKIDVKQL